MSGGAQPSDPPRGFAVDPVRRLVVLSDAAGIAGRRTTEMVAPPCSDGTPTLPGRVANAGPEHEMDRGDAQSGHVVHCP